MSALDVTQEDRDAGGGFWDFLGQRGSAEQCRNGTGFHATAEAFARHRIAAIAAKEAELAAERAKVEKLRETLGQIADRAAKLKAGTDDWFELVEFEQFARATLAETQP